VAAFFAGVTGLYATIVALSFLFLAITLLLHRTLWPILKRPLYALQRFHLLQQRKLMFFAGVTLIGVASPGIAAFFSAVARRLFQ